MAARMRGGPHEDTSSRGLRSARRHILPRNACLRNIVLNRPKRPLVDTSRIGMGHAACATWGDNLRNHICLWSDGSTDVVHGHAESYRDFTYVDGHTLRHYGSV